MILSYTINDEQIAEELAAKGELLDAALLETVGTLGMQLKELAQSKIAPVIRTAIGQGIFDSIQQQAAACVDGICSTSVGIDDEGQPSYIVAYVREFGGEKWYDIFPVRAKSLHFFVGGGGGEEGFELGVAEAEGGASAEVFARHVHHPPAKEQSYLRSSLVEMQDEVRAAITETVAGVLAA